MDFDSEFIDGNIGEEYNEDYETAAHQAAAEGNGQLLVTAIEQDPGSIQQRDNEGYTPLVHAVLGRHMSALKRLVTMGADLDIQDGQGRTCLSICAYQGWSEGLVYLLRKGARPDVTDNSGRTPLHAATYDTDVKSLVTLIKHLNRDDINIGDNEKMTALHWAAFHNRPDHVRILVAKGANPCQTDIDGKTALHWAAQNGNRSCCVILLDTLCGRDLIVKTDVCGKSALHLAAAAGHVDIVQDMASHAPHLCDLGDHDDRTPLHWAAAMGQVGCVRALLRLGVVPEPRDVDGVTPLEYAKCAGHTECKSHLEHVLRTKSDYKRQQEEIKGSTVGFFKGLFSKKKNQGKSDLPVDTDRLPAVNNSKNVARTIQDKTENEKGLSEETNTARVNNKSTTDNDSVKEDKVGANIAQGEDKPSHRKRKKKRRHKKDGPGSAGISPSSKQSEDTKDNSHTTTPGRGIHLSPLEADRPSFITSQLAPTVSRRQGALSPLVPAKKEQLQMTTGVGVKHLRQEPEGRSVSPSSASTAVLNIHGRSVLPKIPGQTPAPLSGDVTDRVSKRTKTKSGDDIQDYVPHTFNVPLGVVGRTKLLQASDRQLIENLSFQTRNLEKGACGDIEEAVGTLAL